MDRRHLTTHEMQRAVGMLQEGTNQSQEILLSSTHAKEEYNHSVGPIHTADCKTPADVNGKKDQNKTKMAGDDALIPVNNELEDSGIDSDEDRMARARLAELHHSETNSSEEDSNENDVNDPLLESITDDFEKLKMRSLRALERYSECDLDRSSPQLFEVELTASDEDEDSSVFELVIPIQSSRYKRAQRSSWFWLDILFCHSCLH